VGERSFVCSTSGKWKSPDTGFKYDMNSLETMSRCVFNGECNSVDRDKVEH